MCYTSRREEIEIQAFHSALARGKYPGNSAMVALAVRVASKVFLILEEGIISTDGAVHMTPGVEGTYVCDGTTIQSDSRLTWNIIFPGGSSDLGEEGSSAHR